MGDLDTKIKSINEKIKKEEQMRLAAVRVKSSTQNSMVQAQAEQNIVDASRHIDYLTKELEKLQVRQRNSLQYPAQTSGQHGGYYHQTQPIQPHSYTYPQAPGGQQGGYYATRSILPQQPPYEDPESISAAGRKNALSNLDLIKSDTPITNAKVSLKLHELEFKLGVEQKLKEGSEKMIEAVTLSNPKDRKSIQEVTVKTMESQEKLSILKRSLHKYKQLYIGVDEEDEEETERVNKPGLRRPVTGKLDVRVLQARNVPHSPLITQGRAPDTTVMIKIDGTTKGKTRVARNDRWNEDFEFHVEKASEIEITLYDKTSEQHQVPIGLLWIKISDIAEELRKKRIEAEANPGWVTAANAQFETGSPTNTNNGPLADTYSVPYTIAQTQQGIGTTYLPDGIEAWFEVEPAGQILLKLNFVKENARKRPADAGLGLGLGRQGAVRKRKGEIHEQNGHKFIQQIFYQIMKCAYCEELFVNEGYQCDDCKLTCHRRCYTKMVTKCISKSNAELDSSDYKQLNHRIPHRFEAITNITANWCCHCGYMLPLGKRGAKRCSECNITCHAKCTHLVPDFCGMTMKRASEMIDQIQRAASFRVSKTGSVDSHSPHPNELSPLPSQPLPSSPKQSQFAYPPSQPYPPQGPEDIYGGQPIQAYNQPGPVSSYNQPGHVPVISSPVPSKPPSQGTPYVQQNVSMQHQIRSSPNTPSPPQNQNESIIQKNRKVGLDDFNFLAVLGKGNFGKVMLAEEKYTKKLYAIKVLKKEFIIENDEVESTRSEKRVFQAANRERHPFLLGLHSCFQTETRIYFVMEYVSGGDLMLHIQKEQFTYRRAQFYAAEVLLALEYLHKSGIIYRDLKLDNILLTLDGHIKIADYGLCKEEMWWGNTTNTFCGTPEFMAPEILLEQRYGRAVDWWAFGVLIYEMLLGQSPFRGDDEDEIFDAILEDEILYPINMSRDSVSILQKLLTREPEKRLGSGRGDAEEIKRHPFFKGVNWDDMLAKKVPPPFYPSISSPTDTSNFDEEFTREVPVLTPVHSHLNAEAQEEFKGFSYVSDWVVGS